MGQLVHHKVKSQVILGACCFSKGDHERRAGGGRSQQMMLIFGYGHLEHKTIHAEKDSRLPKREMGFVADSKFTQ